jgi:hypothetical protein
MFSPRTDRVPHLNEVPLWRIEARQRKLGEFLLNCVAFVELTIAMYIFLT